MKYNTFTLANGLRVIHLPSSAPVLYLGYVIKAGSMYEETGEEGLAHFCEHMSFKGTERRNSRQVITCLENIGGYLDAYTTKEVTVFYATVTREYLQKAVDLLSDMVFHSVFPQTEIEKEAEVICDEIDSYKDTPSEYITDDFERKVFEGHPLGHDILGEKSKVRKFTTADALRFTHRLYRTDNAVFFASGDIDFKHLLKLLERHAPAAEIPMKPSFFETSMPSITHQQAPIPTHRGEVFRIDRHTHQTHAVVGCVMNDLDEHRKRVLALINSIVCGSTMNSRLNIALRERRGLVYNIESSFGFYTDTSFWYVYFGCDHSDADKCLKIVRRELDKMMQNKLTEGQLKRAKQKIKGETRISADYREDFSLAFGRVFLTDGKELDNDLMCQEIESVTADEIQAMAQEMFHPDNMTTLLYI